MPKLDGICVIDAIRQENASALHHCADDLPDTDAKRTVALLKAGAKAYLLKDAGREVLLDCIRKVFAGETCLSAAVAAAGRLSGDSPTAREIEVLSFLAQGKSNKEIGESLYQRDDGEVSSQKVFQQKS